MSKTVIKIENLSKIYRLGEVGTGTISHDLNRFWHMNVLGKEDPYAKIGHVNDRTAKAEKGELVAALSDINLEVKEGEILGIIGKNGAGKSTLLKILSRVTSPTTGSIKVKGRMASLLEVGTGFHPEMTGRENIYMNGTIMGMRRWEIDKQFDAIVDFAGIAKYVDTPVKRYSSGMTVRLGFAIAAHLEPEILIVDEVLAVGDAEFQKKAIGKMQDVSKYDGRTVLFVSHNMAAVKSLCKTGIQMVNGGIAYSGAIDNCVTNYLQSGSTLLNFRNTNDLQLKNGEFELLEIGIKAIGKDYTEPILMTDSLEFLARFKQKSNKKRIDLTIHVKDEQGDKIFSAGTFQSKNDSSTKNTVGKYNVRAVVPANFFNWGNFYIDLYVVEDCRASYLLHRESAHLDSFSAGFRSAFARDF